MIRLPATRREEGRLMEELLSASPKLLSSLEWLDEEDMSSIKTAVVLKLWIEESSEDHIYGEWGVHSGDLLAAVDTAEWIASALARISSHIGMPGDYARALETLASRIRYGVKSELEDLRAASPEDLVRLPLIGPSTARQIMEFLGRSDDARGLAQKEAIERRGLLAFLDNDAVASEEAD